MPDTYVIVRALSGGKMVWCQSQLAVAVTVEASEITLLAGYGVVMPASYPFYLLCENEILGCTGKNGDVLTVIRGVNDTDPATHAAGKIVRLVIRTDDVNEAVLEMHANVLDHAQNSDTGLDSAFESTLEKVASKGAAGGYAPLDGTGKVPSANLPPAGSGGDVLLATTYDKYAVDGMLLCTQYDVGG